MHGRAVRAAYSMGLHSENSLRQFEPIEAELRKRTWYACVVIDRNLSMTFGRPPSIPGSFVRMPLPAELPSHDFNATSAAPLTPELSRLSLSFFNATIQLYRILSDVLEHLYEQNLGTMESVDTSKMAERISAFETTLAQWRAEVDNSFRVIHGVGLHEAFEAAKSRLFTILTLRQLNVQTLLHRPVLQRLLDDRGETLDSLDSRSPFLDKVTRNSTETCLSAARGLISTIHQNSGQKRRLGAWWYSLYYTFHSSLVILAVYLVARRDHLPCVSITTAEASDILDMANEALVRLDKGNYMIERCRLYLQQLVRLCLYTNTNQVAQPLGDHRENDIPRSAPNTISHKPANDQIMHTGSAQVSNTLANSEEANILSAFTDINDLDLGPFINNDDLDFFSLLDDPLLQQPGIQ